MILSIDWISRSSVFVEKKKTLMPTEFRKSVVVFLFRVSCSLLQLHSQGISFFFSTGSETASIREVFRVTLESRIFSHKLTSSLRDKVRILISFPEIR